MIVCVCGHGEAMHDIARNGQRTSCSVQTGALRCSCVRFSADHRLVERTVWEREAL